MPKLRSVVIIAITFSPIITDKTLHVGACKLSSSHTGIKCISVSKKTTNESLRMHTDMHLGLNILPDEMLIDVEGFLSFQYRAGERLKVIR